MSTPQSFNPNIIYQDLPKVPSFAIAHGTVMGLAFVVFFPIGAVLIRFLKFKHALWIHIACQLLGWFFMLAGLATGIRLGKIIDRLHNNTHTILGTVVVAALLVQPLFGYLHHRKYLATKTRTAWTHLHVWYGRVLLILGLINGGLGLMLASNTPAYSKAGTIVYSTLAAISGAVILVMIILSLKPVTEIKDEAQT